MIIGTTLGWGKHKEGDRVPTCMCVRVCALALALACMLVHVRACMCVKLHSIWSLFWPLITHRTQWKVAPAGHSLPSHLERWVGFFLLDQIHFPEVWCQYTLPLKARKQHWALGEWYRVLFSERGFFPSPSPHPNKNATEVIDGLVAVTFNNGLENDLQRLQV